MHMPRWSRLLLIAALGLALPVVGCTRTAKTGPLGKAPSPSAPAAGPSSAVPTPAPTPASASTAPPAPEPSANAVAERVTVQRSGGFAGVMQTLVVEKDGQWRYSPSDRPAAGTVKTGRLSAADLRRLQLLLGDPSFGPPPDPGSCADGFRYSLTAGQRRAVWDDCGGTIPATGARAIVDLLANATPF